MCTHHPPRDHGSPRPQGPTTFLLPKAYYAGPFDDGGKIYFPYASSLTLEALAFEEDALVAGGAGMTSSRSDAQVTDSLLLLLPTPSPVVRIEQRVRLELPLLLTFPAELPGPPGSFEALLEPLHVFSPHGSASDLGCFLSTQKSRRCCC